MFELPTIKNRVCASSFVNEQDLPKKGQKLLDCGRCRGVCYRSREEQVAHWPIHKQVCCREEEDDLARQFLQEVRSDTTQMGDSIFQRIKSIAWDLNKLKGRTLVYALKYLKWYLEEEIGQELEDSPDRMHETSTAVQNVVVLEGLKAAATYYGQERYVRLLWAIPGFANWALSDDIMLSRGMLRRREQGIPPGKFHLCFTKEYQISAGWSSLLFALCNLNLLSYHNTTLGHDRPLDMPLTPAIIRHQVKGWLSPYSREGTPWPLQRAKIQAIVQNVVQDMSSLSPNEAIKADIRPGELIPGLSAKRSAEGLS